MIIYKVFYHPPPDLVYFDDMHNSALCRAGEGGSFTLVLVPVLFMVMVLVMVLVMVTRDFPPTFRCDCHAFSERTVRWMVAKLLPEGLICRRREGATRSF